MSQERSAEEILELLNVASSGRLAPEHRPVLVRIGGPWSDPPPPGCGFAVVPVPTRNEAEWRARWTRRKIIVPVAIDLPAEGK